MPAFRHGLFGNNPVFFSYVVKQIPDTSVVDRRRKEMRHLPVIHVFVCRKDHIFKKQVGFFQHVPEINIIV